MLLDNNVFYPIEQFAKLHNHIEMRLSISSFLEQSDSKSLKRESLWVVLMQFCTDVDFPNERSLPATVTGPVHS